MLIWDSYFRMTYNATLAELTSLEEMMRQYMEEGNIPDEVVSKLWMVYSKLETLVSTLTRSCYVAFAPRFRQTFA